MPSEKSPQQLHVTIRGRVQGVFFRAWTQETAVKLGLTGWVKNLRDGKVEVLSQGKKETLEKFLSECRKGPPAAHVEEIEHEYEKIETVYPTFEIRF